jgi:NitT/TauT family transport system substrate-binding protein
MADRRVFIQTLAGTLAWQIVPASVAGAQEPLHVRVGASPVDVGGPVYYAADQGFFKQHGLDVEIVSTANGPAAAAAIVSGGLDIASGNALSIAQAHDRGVNFLFVAPSGGYTSSDPTAALVVAKTSTAKSAKDFTGKTFGVNTVGSLGQIAICEWLDKNGVDWRAARFVELPYSAMVPAMVAGRIDAALMTEPALDNAIAGDGKVFASIYDAIAKDFIDGGFFASADYVKTHMDVIRRFNAAIAEAARWGNANRPASAKILEKYSGVPAAQMVHRVRYYERVDPASIQPMIDAAAKYGTLKASFPASDIIAVGL